MLCSKTLRILRVLTRKVLLRIEEKIFDEKVCVQSFSIKEIADIGEEKIEGPKFD